MNTVIYTSRNLTGALTHYRSLGLKFGNQKALLNTNTMTYKR